MLIDGGGVLVGKHYKMNCRSLFSPFLFFPLSLLPLLGLCMRACCAELDDGGRLSLSDAIRQDRIRVMQGWGVVGLDLAASAQGGGNPLRIGETEYEQGVGHHANGALSVRLNGEFDAFRAKVGVQWQGGDRGSVLFRALVDGEEVFSCGPLSDSDEAVEMVLDLKGREVLRLVAEDAGDGIACDMADWCNAVLLWNADRPRFGAARVLLEGDVELKRSREVTGFSFLHQDQGNSSTREGQGAGAWVEPLRRLSLFILSGQTATVTVPLNNVREGDVLSARVELVQGRQALVLMGWAGESLVEKDLKGEGSVARIQAIVPAGPCPQGARFSFHARGGDAGFRWSHFELTRGTDRFDVYAAPRTWEDADRPVPLAFTSIPAFLQEELVEWDWRMQDGIGMERGSVEPDLAFQRTVDKGDSLLSHLSSRGVSLGALEDAWRALKGSDSKDWEDRWLQTHRLLRQMIFANPLSRTGPLVFVKQVPGAFSHQLTQYYGACALPGGGLYLLERPGQSMSCENLLRDCLPTGSVQHVDVSEDGKRLLFAFCEMSKAPEDWRTAETRFHLVELDRDARQVRRLTDGPFDDFCPRYLPDGGIVFLTTRRGGFHRCGRGPCPTYVLARMENDGSGLRVLSRHETHEWDPSVLNDGQVIYTRWDYVDRSAVFYQQLWTTRPDGTGARMYYGNNTFNPVGVWEARSVPGSQRIMATAAAHHAMTAGSIILVDVTKGVDGLDPITRLTQDCLFPESEFPVQHWHAPIGVKTPPAVPEAERRWPGHCYRSPFPLTESFFLAAYSFDSLIGEPRSNLPNLFGIYLVDRFGNKELLHRDPNIASLWPVPLSLTASSPVVASATSQEETGWGTCFLSDVYEGWPPLPASEKARITGLRIVQVLPKSTPHANEPRVGWANASPGKQVLGTVPVEEDGSAFFRVPADTPVCFQALDPRGRAVQMMRSIVYVKPGERISCVGCHERRSSAAHRNRQAQALKREPSLLRPAPEGSCPLSFPLLVQPVLDRLCVRCHSGEKPRADLVLTSLPDGPFSRAYNALAPRVPYPEWQGGDFLKGNSEPVTYPDRFGSRASPLLAMLDKGHHEVCLSAEDEDRLITWMDANALFYGTFDSKDQERQRRGERIEGPVIE